MLYYRRLEKGTFPWPEDSSSSPQMISHRQFRWLLDGLSIDQKSAHPKVTAQRVI
ncbi:mobile element protein [Halalkalibacter wakoensis JCM 9140]|uniref:Mobile element protein n=1 Tax=Halalkalibacter wakoensis JCM 9140 TaxID=1236970 RepID=W4Q9H7_9BACI|nr:mobile element protein [Halalkalibacter wakoensis JCM 9140]